MIEHWLFSVKQHVTLESIDLMVVDFGLSDDQRAQLRANGVIIWPAKLDGRWSNIQYRELAAFLDQSPVDYDQVVYSDCGDIVFQADIRPILDTYKDQIRAVIEPEFGLVLHGLTLGCSRIWFSRSFREKISHSTRTSWTIVSMARRTN